MSPQARDEADRKTAATDFSRNLAVEAGAGSGKTSLLLERALNLLLFGRIEPRDLVAITFTEKAASQLGEKLAQELDLIRRAPELGPEDGKRASARSWAWLRGEKGLSTRALKERASALLQSLDEARLSTIHRFCGEILRTWPREAGVDPAFEADEDGSGMEAAVEEAWLETLRRAGAEPKALFGDEEPADIRALAGALAPPEFPQDLLNNPAQGEEEALAVLRKEAAAIQSRLEKALAASQFKKAGTKIETLSKEALSALARGIPPQPEALTLGEGDPKEVQGADKDLEPAAKEARRFLGRISTLDPERVRRALALALPLALDARRRFLAKGLLSFHSMLTLTRDLLLGYPAIREECKERWKVFLVDEFQDTDPIQYEILFLLCEKKGLKARDGYEADLEPGRLFCVGDPKQAIYGFRGANLAAFERAVAKITGGQDPLRLTTNYRSLPEVLAPINSLLQPLMLKDPGLQPAYAGLRAHRAGGQGPAVELWDLGAPAGAWDRRRGEAKAIASWIAGRAARGENKFGDLALVFRAFTQVGPYLQALHDQGVPFVVSGGKDFSSRREVAEGLALFRTVLGPEDPPALLAVLRSALGGCTDAELAAWAQSCPDSGYPGPWSPVHQPDPKTHPALASVFERLRHLRKLAAEDPSPARTDRILEESGYLLVLAAGPEAARKTANVRKMAARIRRLAEDKSLTLREALDRVIEGAKPGDSEDGESPLADESVNAVKVFTIHKAKGLEFPVVIVADLAGELGGRMSRDKTARAALLGQGSSASLALTLSDGSRNPQALLQERLSAKAESAEYLRLAYVAMTRAEERLILPRVQPERLPRGKATGLSLLGGLSALREPEVLLKTAPTMEGSPPVAAAPKPSLFLAGLERHRQLRDLEKKHPAWREFASQADTQDSRDAELEPQSEGEHAPGGRNLGRAMHRLMEAGLEEPGAELLKNIAASEEVDEAGLRELWNLGHARRWQERLKSMEILGREIPLLYSDEDGILCEGRIDLLARDKEGYLVIDWKTDSVDPSGLKKAYAEQMGFYRKGIQDILGKGSKVNTVLANLRTGENAEV